MFLKKKLIKQIEVEQNYVSNVRFVEEVHSHYLKNTETSSFLHLVKQGCTSMLMIKSME